MKIDTPLTPVAMVEQIYISPGHNYFYHQGKEPGTNPTDSVSEARCLAGRGIEGDRFLDHKRNYSGQITFFDLEVFDEMARALKVVDKVPGVLRRNVFVRGLDLTALTGREFSLQGILFFGQKECTPCPWMDLAIGPGAYLFCGAVAACAPRF